MKSAEIRELFRRYKEEGDEEAREQLIVSHVNLVRYIAAKFKNRGEPLDDLIQVGTIGLIKAIDRFDPSRGLEFTTYATPTIMGEIKRHFRDKGWTIRVPRRLQELSAKVNSATDELTAQLQRSPSIEEVADYLGNTPAVARASYIDPRIFDRYEGGLIIRPALEKAAEAPAGEVPIHQPALEKAVLDLIDERSSAPGVERIAA